MTNPQIKRALISVSNKSGIVDFAKALIESGVELISTGGTSQLLADAGILHSRIEELTGLPEMLDGRVKTLHPVVYGGILGRRDVHADEVAKLQIPWIDMVVVNFYPFSDAVNKTTPMDQAVEYIDIGGPTMVRAAAKNFAWVSVVVDPTDYPQIINQLESESSLDTNTRRYLAQKAFALTSHYDTLINQYFLAQDEKQTHKKSPSQLHLRLEKKTDLRYGENPHQMASAYQITPTEDDQPTGILQADLLQGKVLSYNNILDAEAAWICANEFVDLPACIIVKHANPCGAACAKTLEEAFQLAYAADPLSAFGGIIALNQPCTKAIAEVIAALFMEVVIAPDYSEEAQTILATKPNLRVLKMGDKSFTTKLWEMKYITGGFLLQEKDQQMLDEHGLQVVTDVHPSVEDIQAMLFAWRVLKHIKSNGILIAKNNATVGIGAGQVSRIDAVDIAMRKAGDNIKSAILASDAFFPFRDSIDRIANPGGIRAIIQPGGSKRDEEVIAACNEHEIAMVFTGKRCFRH